MVWVLEFLTGCLKKDAVWAFGSCSVNESQVCGRVGVAAPGCSLWVHLLI